MANSDSNYKSARLEIQHSEKKPEKVKHNTGGEIQLLITMDNHFSLLQTCPLSDSPPKPVTEFPIFGNLPTELRLKIWEFAVLGLYGRIVALNIITGKKRIRTRITCQRPHPSISFVCREARQMTLETLGPLFPTDTPHDIISADLEKDKIIIGTNWGRKHIKHFIKAVGEEKAKTLKNLAIEFEREPEDERNAVRSERIYTEAKRIGEYEVYDIPNCFNGLREIYDSFPALKRLVFIPHMDAERDGSHKLVGELLFEKQTYGMLNEAFDYRGTTYEGWAVGTVTYMWCSFLWGREPWASIERRSIREKAARIDFMQLGVKEKVKKKFLTAKGDLFWAVM